MILTKEQIKFYYKNVLNYREDIITSLYEFNSHKQIYLYVYKNDNNTAFLLISTDLPSKDKHRLHITHIKEIVRYFKIKEILE